MGSPWATPKTKSNFFSEITEQDPFYFNKIANVLAELWMLFYTVTAVFTGNDTFLTENITQDKKRFITQSNIWYFHKIKTFWKLMISDLLLLFLPKNFFTILNVALTMTSFLCKLGPKKQFLRGFTNVFSELLDCNTSY